MTPLADSFLATPFAHRGLHDLAAGCPENSISAINAAITAGYGIELDVQPSSNGVAMVFHDYDLGRLTPESGPFQMRTSTNLTQIPLNGSKDTVPTLAHVLKIVAGQVPLLVEMKDQDGAMGPNTGHLEQAVATDLQAYGGDVAVMSYNPYSVGHFSKLLPNTPRGIVTGPFHAENWGLLPEKTRARLREIPDFERVDASFITHRVDDLNRPRVSEIKKSGVPILCWTVRDRDTEATARTIADNITFEHYLPQIRQT